MISPTHAFMRNDMTIHPMKDKFFEEHKHDMSLDPQYGIIQSHVLDICDSDHLKKIGDKTEARVNSNQNGIRSVDCWRLPIDSFVGNIIKEKSIYFNSVFNYKISNIGDIQYLEYKKGDYYNWHSDISDGIASTRKISISWLLNDSFTGGELVFQHGGDEYIAKVGAGKHGEPNMVGFTSFYTHRVKPIKSGTRKSIVAWVHGESWR